MCTEYEESLPVSCSGEVVFVSGIASEQAEELQNRPIPWKVFEGVLTGGELAVNSVQEA